MSWKCWLIAQEYRLLLWLGRAPRLIAEPLTYLRAAWQISIGGDWRQLIEGEHLRERQKLAMQEIGARHTLYHRFLLHLAWCQEELASSQLIQGHTPPIIIDGAPNPEPTIFLLSHFGHSIPAASFAAKLAVPSYAVASTIIDHRNLPESVKKFYYQKYAALERHFLDGKVLYYESHLKKILEALETPANLFVVTDLPPAPRQAKIAVPFFGKERYWSAGAIKMAIHHNRPVQPYYAISYNGRWRVTFGPTVTGSKIDDFLPAYRFLAEAIESHPHLWWALDLLAAQPLSQ